MLTVASAKDMIMPWGIRIFAVMILSVLLWLLFRPPSNLPVSPPTEPVLRTTPTVASLNATAPVRVTVYQDSSTGVSSFSDRSDRGQPHVIDHSKGNTYQSTYHGEVPNTASATYSMPELTEDPIEYLKQDNARFQQHVQDSRQQRIQHLIGE
jgi:hypothetical protein